MARGGPKAGGDKRADKRLDQGQAASSGDNGSAEAGDPGAAAEAAQAGHAKAAGAAQPADIRRWLPFMGLGVAVWASLPRFSGPGEPRFIPDPAAEFANHVVPAIAVALASLWVIAARRRAKGPGAAPFFGGLVVLLGGLFMVATHAPLVAQALRDEAPWDAAIYHSSSALAVFGLGLLWSVTHWSDLDSFDSKPDPAPDGA